MTSTEPAPLPDLSLYDDIIRSKLVANQFTPEELDILAPPPETIVASSPDAERIRRCKIIFHNAAVRGIIAARQTRKQKKQRSW